MLCPMTLQMEQIEITNSKKIRHKTDEFVVHFNLVCALVFSIMQMFGFAQKLGIENF